MKSIVLGKFGIGRALGFYISRQSRMTIET